MAANRESSFFKILWNDHQAVNFSCPKSSSAPLNIWIVVSCFKGWAGIKVTNKSSGYAALVQINYTDRKISGYSLRKDCPHEKKEQERNPGNQGKQPGIVQENPPFPEYHGCKRGRHHFSTSTLILARNPSIGLIGRASTSKLRMSNPLSPLVARQVAKSPITATWFTRKR